MPQKNYPEQVVGELHWYIVYMRFIVFGVESFVLLFLVSSKWLKSLYGKGTSITMFCIEHFSKIH